MHGRFLTLLDENSTLIVEEKQCQSDNQESTCNVTSGEGRSSFHLSYTFCSLHPPIFIQVLPPNYKIRPTIPQILRLWPVITKVLRPVLNKR
jgi:hypothetical protein